MALDSNEKVVQKSAFYRNGYDKLTEPTSTWVTMEDSVVLFTGSQTTSKQILAAINKLVKLCNEDVKEPF